jgi:hypothetical protein
MNCNYRILKDVHIGQRVRKTKDKTTVPFKNDPMTDVRIKDWSQLGFKLSHPDLPKEIWVDFWQLPLDTIQLEYGVIKNPITFVEQIMVGGSMVLVRADTLDYMEMVHDKKEKEEAATYGVRALTPGDRVISAICKHGNVMVYLGTFNIATYSYVRNYSHGYRSDRKTFYYVNETPERAFFAYEDPDGTYNIKSYPIQNKIVKENHLASDKDKGDKVDPQFTDESKNLQMILDFSLTNRYEAKHSDEKIKEIKEQYPKMKYSHYDSICFMQKGKINIRENALSFIKECDLMQTNEVYLNQQDANEAWNKWRR